MIGVIGTLVVGVIVFVVMVATGLPLPVAIIATLGCWALAIGTFGKSMAARQHKKDEREWTRHRDNRKFLGAYHGSEEDVVYVWVKKSELPDSHKGDQDVAFVERSMICVKLSKKEMPSADLDYVAEREADIARKQAAMNCADQEPNKPGGR